VPSLPPSNHRDRQYRRRAREKRIDKDLDSGIKGFILLVLLKEGPLTKQELEEKTAVLILNFRFPHDTDSRRVREEEQQGVDSACSLLVEKELLRQNQEGRYVLTRKGQEMAEGYQRRLERGAEFMEKQFLSPSAAARNTTLAYFLLSIIKLMGGFFGGSVGLIADGADTAVDTASAFIVWFGMRAKKEVAGTLVTIALMFGTALMLGYESSTSILENIEGLASPMTNPFLVIAVEGLSLASLLILSYYQRYIGRRGRSLALISQSIDSKNSVYSAAAVIVGAIISLFGVFWVDAVVGGLIAARIAIDAFTLLRDTLRYLRGQELDFTKYKLPFEERIRQGRQENMINWSLYVIHQNQPCTKAEIVASMDKNFNPKYLPPIFNELAMGGGHDFEKEFDGMVKPLVDKGYLHKEEGRFILTAQGEKFLWETLGKQEIG